MVPYLPAIEAAMRTCCAALRERDRRLYAAVEAAKRGHGGVAYMAPLLPPDPQTIPRGLPELPPPPPPPPRRCPQKGGGATPNTPPPPTPPPPPPPPRPHLHVASGNVLPPPPAGSPEDAALFWTSPSRQEIAARLRAAGYNVSARVVSQLLDAHDFHRRGLFKSLAMGAFARRDAQ